MFVNRLNLRFVLSPFHQQRKHSSVCIFHNKDVLIAASVITFFCRRIKFIDNVVNLRNILGRKVHLPVFFLIFRMCIFDMPHIVSGNKHLVNVMTEKFAHFVPQFL